MKTRSLRASMVAVLTIGVLTNPVFAQQDSADSQASDELSEIVVTGRRVSDATLAIGEDEAGQTVSVTRAALLSAPAGVSGLKALEALPGFNVQTDGALGLYEFGNSVTVRAFNFEQVGFLLDGIPMGRPDPFGGSPIFRYVDNENLGQVRASPGSGDVSLPTAMSLGPVVEYLTTPTSDDPSAMLSVAFGDFGLQRSFVKLETGDLNGFSGYVSRSKTDTDLWRGPGTVDREHVEAKAQYDFDGDTFIRAQLVYNDFFDFDSPSMSRAQYESETGDSVGRTGRDRAYVGTVPDLGVGPDVVFQDSGYTQYYIDRVNIREDLLVGVSFGTDLTEDLDLRVVGYYEDKDGFGVSPDSYSNTLGNYEEQLAAGVESVFNLPLAAPRGVQYGLSTVGGDRKGITAGIEWQVNNHRIEVGGWFEEETYNRQQLRLNKEGGNPAGAVLFDEVAYYRRDYTSDREFTQYYVKDTIELLDGRMRLEAGVKGLFLSYGLSGFRDFDDYSRSVGGTPTIGFGPQVIRQDFDEAFLPNIGVVYDFTETEQLFASVSKNFSLPREADSLFDNIARPDVEGEESTNYEFGVRTNRPEFNAALAVYFIDFDNRIEVAGREVPGSPGLIETVGQNIGGVESYGIEFIGNWKPRFFNDLAYFSANLTYNVSEFTNEILSGSGAPVGIDGKQLPDTPKTLGTLGFTLEPTDWIVANISARYTDDRYADFINTQPMESYTVVDAYVDIGGEDVNFGAFDNISIRLNVTNLTDEDTLSFTFGTISGTAFYRPLSPRTAQVSVTAVF